MKMAIGIDIGGTNIKVVLVSEDGKVLTSQSHPSPSDGNGVNIQELLFMILKGIVNEEALRAFSSGSAGVNDIAGIGFGIAG